MTFSAQTRRRLLVGAFGCLLVLFACALLVTLDVGADGIDRTVGDPLTAWTRESATVRAAAEFVQVAFSTIPVTGYTLLAVVLLLVRGFRRTAAWIGVVMLGEWLSMLALKAAFGRPRPENAIIGLGTPAFPSGHASGAAAGAGVAIVLAVLFLRRRNQRRMVLGGALLLAFVIGLDRILLGVHGLVDVVAGWCLGAAWVLAAAYFVDPTPRSKPVPPLPSPLPSSRRLAVVLNPIKVEDKVAFRELVGSMARSSGWEEPVWYETTIEDPGRSMAEQAALGGADLVVVCGGDGTVRTVCGELAGTGIPVGVVPAGTGNLLARNVGLPLYLRSAVDVALNGQDRAIDLVRVTGDGIGEDEHFLVMAGMGFDAAIMEGANEQIKAKVGWLAYVVSGLRNMMFPAIRVDIRIDEGAWTRHRARTIVVGNVGMLQGGLPLLPDATIDDGRLDLVLLYPRRFLSWLRIVVRVLSRNRRTDETVTRMTGRSVVVRAAHDTPRQVDGDPIGAGREIACECLAGRLLIRVPR